MAIEINMEAHTEYEKYMRLGKKEKEPMPVLDDILKEKHEEIAGEYSLGLVQIPLDKIVGTKTAGRGISFSKSFYPVMGENTEFANKWKILYTAHIEEGIRDAVKVYEYMNRFYVEEGNKRVSVLKCVGAAEVPGIVTRILPFRTEEKSNRIYYEFIDFYRLSKLYDIELSEEGGYARLQQLTGKRPDESWTEEDRRDFRSLYFFFKKIYGSIAKEFREEAVGDAFLNLLRLYEYKKLLKMEPLELKELMQKSLGELKLEKTPQLLMEPGKVEKKKNFLVRLLPANSPVLNVAFVHEKTAETSSWTYAHELGRFYLQEVFPGQIHTSCYDKVTEENAREVIEQSIADGNKLIFTTAPPLLMAGLHAAMEHPEVKILNCSLNTSHRYIRTYYARMYEAKFLMGALAGAMTEHGRIGYLADYPIYGMTASINAFALGAQMVNPRARVYLEWTTKRGNNPFDTFRKHGISCVSGQDMIVPKIASRHFGLYMDEGGEPVNLAMPVWHWGKFYEQMIDKIINGGWKADEAGDEKKGLNYWWGMSAGVIDVICSGRIPAGTARLVNLLKEEICEERFYPFDGPVYNQKGELCWDGRQGLEPENIRRMDWLVENVEGEIPEISELVAKAKPVVDTQGLKS